MNLSVAFSVDATEKHRFKYASSAAVEADGDGGTETEGPTENEIVAHNWTQRSERQLASVLALPLSDNRSVLDFKPTPMHPLWLF